MQKAPARLPRVSGASVKRNSRQNDERAQKRKNGPERKGDGDSDRKHLTSREVERLIEATKGSRNEARDRCLLLLMFRHGLRVSEATGLNLSQVDLESRVLHVQRLKKGLSTTHPLRNDEIKIIKTWLKERAKMQLDRTPFL